MQQHILLVEDEPGLALTLVDRLESECFRVTHCADGLSGYEAGLNQPFDLVILDLMLPGKNGFDICRDWRGRGVHAPILMLTAKDQVSDKVVGLKLGADDYLTKPFETVELLARIEALLRRTRVNAAISGKDVYRFGEVVVDFRKVTVTRAGVPVELSARLFQLLAYFIRHRETMLSRNDLLDAVWGYDAEVATRTVDVHMTWLRQRLETDPSRPQFFITVYGMGYKFVG